MEHGHQLSSQTRKKGILPVKNNSVQFPTGDPFDDPAWKKSEKKPRRSGGRHIGCPVAWFAWVFPLVRSKEQLLVALYLYKRCHVCGRSTVSVPTGDLTEFGLSRFAKYRALAVLEGAGIVRVEERADGQTTMVTLIHWPNPPPPVPSGAHLA